jgi:hypothetical protein
VAGDSDKWLLVVDNTHPQNSGWYRIDSYVDVNNVDIDFKTDVTEFPTVATGLTWYLMAEDYAVPVANGDWWKLRTPHAHGWEIEALLNVTTGGPVKLSVRVSLNQDWTTAGKILGSVMGGPYAQYNDLPTNFTWYVEGNDDGSYVNIFCHNVYGSGVRNMCSVVPITPWELIPTHSDDEKWALMGPNVATYGSVADNITRQYATTHSYWSSFYLWRDVSTQGNPGSQVDGSLLEWSRSGGNQGFTYEVTREINARRGGNDVMIGSHGIVDWDNIHEEYEMVGRLGGHESIRANLNKMQTINHAGGTKNRVHIGGGILLPWPGYTPQFTP